LFQAAMVRLAEGRRLSRHAGTVQAEYRRRRDALLEALQAEMPAGVTWTRPAGGFGLVVRLAAGVDSGQILPRAAEKGVLYTAGRVFSLSGDTRLLRLSFGSTKASHIAEGIKRLAAVVKEDMARTARNAGRRAASVMAPPV
jgi:DNA-binding transcriptional MocR family regulator